MKNAFRQIAVAIAILATLVVNILADALPINGLNTGAISDQFHVLFVPAGYVFAIWGVIYLGLITYGVYQALPAQRDNPRLRRVGFLFALSCLANIAWLFFWHYLQFPLTLLAMLVLLGTLIAIYLILDIGRTHVSIGETWLVRIPFSIYLGWITVATIANVTDLLAYLNWNGWGLAPENWMLILLGAVFVIASLMSLTRRDVAYVLVILWALFGIAVKQSGVGLVADATRWTAAFVAIALLIGVFLAAPTRKVKRA